MSEFQRLMALSATSLTVALGSFAVGENASKAYEANKIKCLDKFEGAERAECKEIIGDNPLLSYSIYGLVAGVIGVSIGWRAHDISDKANKHEQHLRNKEHQTE